MKALKIKKPGMTGLFCACCLCIWICDNDAQRHKVTLNVTFKRSMRFFTTAKLGPTRSKTPEGFLVCADVPIARTGEMLYMPEELPPLAGFAPAEDGALHLYRVADDLFRPEVAASFEGKPVTLGHPEGMEVNPENFRRLAVGTVQNVRRGTGVEAELLLADLLIQDAEAIRQIDAGTVEVSCGYDFDFVPTGRGTGRQTNIVGNHLAIVEAGRCGPSCRIGDDLPKHEAPKMAKLPWWARAMGHAIKAGDEETAAEIAQEREKESDATDEDPIEARLKKLEEGHTAILAAIEELKKPAVGDEGGEGQTEKPEDDEDIAKMKAGDAAALREEWQRISSLSEILAPGCPARLGAMDGSVVRVKAARDAMCKARSAALAHAMSTAEGRQAVEPLLRGRALDSVPCDEQAMIFSAAAEIRRQANNTRITSGDSAAQFALPTPGSLYQSMYGGQSAMRH